MRGFWYDIGLTIAVIAGGMVLFLSIVVGIGAAFESYQCTKYETVTGRPTRYDGLACYVQDGGAWYAWAEYKHRLATKGEFGK